MQFKERVLAPQFPEILVLGKRILRGIAALVIVKIDVDCPQGFSPIFNLITPSPKAIFVIAMLIFFGFWSMKANVREVGGDSQR